MKFPLRITWLFMKPCLTSNSDCNFPDTGAALRGTPQVTLLGLVPVALHSDRNNLSFFRGIPLVADAS